MCFVTHTLITIILFTATLSNLYFFLPVHAVGAEISNTVFSVAKIYLSSSLAVGQMEIHNLK